MEALLNHGTDINARDPDGDTALMIAEMERIDQKEAADFLRNRSRY
jgi:ankyrin repeat protein